MVFTGLAGGIIHLAAKLVVDTTGSTERSPNKWNLNGSREPQGVLITTTPEFITLDISGTSYWEDNMTTREAPINFAQGLEFKIVCQGPAIVEYLIGYDLALTVE